MKCNVHPWMHGYFAVLNTSHYAMTGNDGTFSLKGLPPGKYTVTAWHERFGTQSQEVTVAERQGRHGEFRVQGDCPTERSRASGGDARG